MTERSLDSLSYEIIDTRNKRADETGKVKKRSNKREWKERELKAGRRSLQKELVGNQELSEETSGLSKKEQKRQESIQRKEENKLLYQQDVLETTAGSKPDPFDKKKSIKYEQKKQSVNTADSKPGVFHTHQNLLETLKKQFK